MLDGKKDGKLSYEEAAEALRGGSAHVRSAGSVNPQAHSFFEAQSERGDAARG